MLRSVTLVIVLIFSTAAMAQNQAGPHSEKDEDACDRDAHRFCRDAIPDQMRVLACLQMNRRSSAGPARACCRTAAYNRNWLSPRRAIRRLEEAGLAGAELLEQSGLVGLGSRQMPRLDVAEAADLFRDGGKSRRRDDDCRA